MKLKCKKDYYNLNIINFEEGIDYEMRGESEYTVVIKSDMGVVQFRKMEETLIGINNFSRLSLFTEFFYTKHEMRQMIIQKLLKEEV